ncbi:MAG: metal-dependent transcriptional regulator [Phycisphaeraceae bacterium]
MLSSTVENYLKALYNLQLARPGEQPVPLGQLAREVGVTPGTATAMVKRLADQSLVEYRPRSGARLSEVGRRKALRVLRRHRLVELFLVDVLQLDWGEVHEEAEILEHVVSDRLLARIDDMLGHPTHDPHGDPIPTEAGDIPQRTLVPLNECPIGPAHIARILDHSADFLGYVERHGLGPSTEIEVTARDEQADTVTVVTAAGESVQLGSAAAAKVMVAPGKRG